MIPCDGVSTGAGKVTHRLWWEPGAPLHPLSLNRVNVMLGQRKCQSPQQAEEKKTRKTADVAAKGIEKLN